MTDPPGPAAPRPAPSGADDAARQAYFDGLYRDREEPWDYSRLGAEVMRHELVARTVRSLPGTPHRRVLDLGCSLGQLTCRLAGLGREVHALDLSPAAVEKARARCSQVAGRGSEFRFCAGSVTALPFAPASFDVVLLCDGLVSWRLGEEEKRSALEQAHAVLAPGGFVVMTEALKQKQIDPFVRMVESSPLEVVSVRYLNDRLFYSLERAARPIQHWGAARAALASKRVARALTVLSRLAGKQGTKHICVVARRPRRP